MFLMNDDETEGGENQMATKTNAKRADFMKAGSPAEAAKILGHEDGGRKLRSRLRSLAGTEKANPERWNTENKGKLWAIFAEGKTVAKSEKKAAKPKKASKPKAKAETDATATSE